MASMLQGGGTRAVNRPSTLKTQDTCAPALACTGALEASGQSAVDGDTDALTEANATKPG